LFESRPSYDQFKRDTIAIAMKGMRFDPRLRSFIAMTHNRPRLYMGESEVRALVREGVHIGSHSVDHFVLSRCEPDFMDGQVAENVDYLESLTNRTIDHFALPFGKKEHYSQRVLKCLFEKGHERVYTTNPIPFRRQDCGETHAVLPRIGLTNESAKDIAFYINRTFVRKYDL